ncbi:MAG: hypothetical protein OXC44_07335, partial [Proteobacteria bacterium]|nr:hypothetical protein [Pseudomonadota bacterium]
PASYTHNSMTIPFTNRGATLILEDVDQSITKKPTIIDKSVDDAKAASQAVIRAAWLAASSSRDTWVVPRTRQAIMTALAPHCSTVSDIDCKTEVVDFECDANTASIAAKSTADALNKMICNVMQTTTAISAVISAVAVKVGIEAGTDDGTISFSRRCEMVASEAATAGFEIGANCVITVLNRYGNVAPIIPKLKDPYVSGDEDPYERDGDNLVMERVTLAKYCGQRRLKSAQAVQRCKQRDETIKGVDTSEWVVKNPSASSLDTMKYCLLKVPDTSSDYNTFFSLGLKILSFQGYDLCASKKNAGIKKFFGNFMTDEPIPDEHNSLMYGTNRTFRLAHIKFCQ